MMIKLVGGAGKLAVCLRVPASKPDNPSSIPRTPWKERTDCCKLSSDFQAHATHMYAWVHMYPIHTHTISVIKHGDNFL